MAEQEQEKKFSPLTLPLVGATTATAAGIIGGLNIDEWKSMDAKEKAKKLLKCFVMGGIAGIGAEGVRQGYNIVKKRALEKNSNYKKSLLSYMLKKALSEEEIESESKAEDNNSIAGVPVPEEATRESNSILGMPSHLLIGGGLGLAGGLTLYHLLTEQKKKKPTGYVGAGLGGLMAGVLGAGLFKGFSSNKQDVNKGLYSRANNPKKPVIPKPALMEGAHFVGAPDIKLDKNKLDAIQGEDNFYTKNMNGIPGIKTAQQQEKEYIDKIREIAPELPIEAIYQHVKFLNTIAASPYRAYMTTPQDRIGKIWDDSKIEAAKNFFIQQQQKYDLPFNTTITYEQIGSDAELAKWLSTTGDPLALRILQRHHPGVDFSRVTNPLGYALKKINAGEITNPNEVAAFGRLAKNMGAIRAHKTGVFFPHSNALYDAKENHFEPGYRAAKTDNRRLKYQYTTPEEHRKDYLARAGKELYIPADISSDKLNDYLEQLRILRTSDISEEEFAQKQAELNSLIYQELKNNTGIPLQLILSDKRTPSTFKDDKGLYYTVKAPTGLSEEDARKYTNNPVWDNVANPRLVRALYNRGYDFNNLTWKPLSASPWFAKATLGDGLALYARTNTDGQTTLQLSPDPDSEYLKQPTTILGGEALNTLKFTYSGDGLAGKTPDGGVYYRDLAADKETKTKSPAEYITALSKAGTITGPVSITNDIIDVDTPYRICNLSNGYTLKINLITGKYTYLITPKK